MVATISCGDDRAWNHAKAEATIAAYERFLSQFPKSVHREEAERLLNAARHPLQAEGYGALEVTDHTLEWGCGDAATPVRVLKATADVLLRWSDLKTLLNWDERGTFRRQGFDGLAGLVRMPEGMGYFGDLCQGNLRFEGDYFRRADGFLLKAGGFLVHPTVPTNSSEVSNSGPLMIVNP